MPSIFLSYRRKDSTQFAKKLYQELSSELSEFDVFFDTSKITYGDNIPESILDALERANLVFVIIGPEWLDILNERLSWEEKDWVKEEVGLSLSNQSKTIVPILINDTAKPIKEELPEEISNLYDLDEIKFSSKINWNENIKSLLQFVRNWYYNQPDKFLADSLKLTYSKEPLFCEIPIPNLNPNDSRRILMEKYFISPSYIKLTDLDKRDSLLSKENASSASIIRRKRKFQNFIPHSVIASKLTLSETNSLIIGNPGTGKSTFSRWICFDWAASKEKKDIFPLYILLRNIDFTKDNFLLRSLATLFGDISIDSLGYIIQKSNNSKVWILDGYDELSPTHQLLLFNEIQRLGASQFYMLLTRPYGLLFDPGFSFSQRFQLDGFSVKQIEAYISEYLTLFGQRLEKQKLLDILRNNQVLLDYAHNPMMLSFIVGVFLKEDRPEISLAKIDSNYKLQARVFYWIKNREVAKASIEKSPKNLVLDKLEYELAYNMQMSLEFVRHGFEHDEWHSSALKLNNIGLARMISQKESEIIFSFNSITFQEFFSSLFMPSGISWEALKYLSNFPVFWNLLKMIIGKQSSERDSVYIQYILDDTYQEFRKSSDIKFLYLLFVFLAECPKEKVNSFVSYHLLNQFHELFVVNGATSDRWSVLLQEAVQKVYIKLSVPLQRDFGKLILENFLIGFGTAPEGSEDEAYTPPNGTKILIQQLKLYNDILVFDSLLDHLLIWSKIAEESDIYSYEVVVYTLDEILPQVKHDLLQINKAQLIDIFEKIPALYINSTLRIMKIINAKENIYSNDDIKVDLLEQSSSKTELTEEEIFQLSSDFKNLGASIYLQNFERENKEEIKNNIILPYIFAAKEFMDKHDVSDYDSEDIFELISQSVYNINDDVIYNSIFLLAVSANVSYTTTSFSDNQLLFDWYSSTLHESLKKDETENLLMLTYALLFNDAIQIRFHRVGEIYIDLCKKYIDKHRLFFESFNGKHSDIYFQDSSIETSFLRPFDKLLYFGREENLWGEANKISLLKFSMNPSIRKLAYFRDRFIPGMMSADFNLYKAEHWEIVYGYIDSIDMNSVFSIIRNKQIYNFESNLNHVEHIADFIIDQSNHPHFEERTYLITEFCSRVFALVYKVQFNTEYNLPPLIIKLEKLLLLPSIISDFKNGIMIPSTEGIDCLCFVLGYILTGNESMDCVEDYDTLFENHRSEQANFLNGILTILSNIHGINTNDVESIYPIIGETFTDHIKLLIENAGYHMQFDKRLFEGM